MKKRGIFIFLVCFTLLINGCESKENKAEDVPLINYTETITAAQKGDKVNYYKIEGSNLSHIDLQSNVVDFKYNLGSKVYVSLINIKKGKNLSNNKIKVQNNNKVFFIDKYYSNTDIKFSPSSTKIAFTAYGGDSLETIKGLRIYDVKNNKEIEFNSKVLISGNLYSWINDDEIVYYGSNPEEKKHDKIYIYNIKTKTEKVYMNQVEGFCTSLVPLEKKLLYVEQYGEYSRLVFYKSDKNIKKVINNNFFKIYDWVLNSKTKEIFFIGKEQYNGKNALYKVSLEDEKLSKLTFDFPENIDENTGISIDKNGNIYFCGFDSQENNENDIFMYNNKDQSSTLISIESGNYHIFGIKKI